MVVYVNNLSSKGLFYGLHFVKVPQIMVFFCLGFVRNQKCCGSASARTVWKCNVSAEPLYCVVGTYLTSRPQQTLNHAHLHQPLTTLITHILYTLILGYGLARREQYH